MEKKKFDTIISEVLKDKAEPISMSPGQTETMKRNLRNMMKEESHMKKSMTKKVLVAAAAMCLLVSVVSIAGGKIAGYSSGINKDEAIKSYEDIAKAAPGKLGFTPATVEKFENGFTYSEGYLEDVDCNDENFTKVGSFPELTIYYENASQTVLYTASRPLGDKDRSAPDASENFDGVTINYKKDHYKFVPSDYQITEDEQKRIDSGDLYVSYGSDKVELDDVPYVYWIQDGTHYLLMSSGANDVSQDNLVKMAKEVISAGK